MLSEQEFKAKYGPRVRTVKYGEVQSFMDEMFAEELDYGTVCYAVAFAGAAAAWAANKHPTQGGITGFQAGFVLWELISQWDSSRVGETGARLVSYDDLLYPQMGHKFTTITPGTWEAVQKEAAKMLAERKDESVAGVVTHWQSIVDGTVPFGLTISEN